MDILNNFKEISPKTCLPTNYLSQPSHVEKWYDRNGTLRNKVEPKQLHPGAVLENGATLEGGAVFPLSCSVIVLANQWTDSITNIPGRMCLSRFDSTFFLSANLVISSNKFLYWIKCLLFSYQYVHTGDKKQIFDLPRQVESF